MLPPARFDNIPEQRDIINYWVANCVNNHPKCRAAHKGFRPTRLLKIDGFSGSKDVRLIESNQDVYEIPYVALSHCWGPPSKHFIRTTKENIKSHLDRIPFEDLSRTFEDAVDIVREMGLSYLWIDYLCIVQDDEDDWTREASLMADVYHESFCTIAAHSARDGEDGCRVNAAGEVDSLRYVDLDIGEYRIRLIEMESNRDRDFLMWDVEYGDDVFKHRPYGKTPLRSRALTLQERKLSVRSIHFSRSTLLWECLELKASTEVPHDVIQRYDEYTPEPLQPSSLNISAVDRDHWYDMVEDYSLRFLTVESDKLPAMAGLTRRFQCSRLEGGRYLAGLWKEHFPGALLWRVRRQPADQMPGERHCFAAFEPRRPLRYRAPIWSWASIDGEVTYANKKFMMISEGYSAQESSRIALVGATVEAANLYLLKALHHASITVHGQITQARLGDALLGASKMDNRKRRLFNYHGDMIGSFIRTSCSKSTSSKTSFVWEYAMK